jgi:hypothetical protein
MTLDSVFPRVPARRPPEQRPGSGKLVRLRDEHGLTLKAAATTRQSVSPT